MQHLIRKLEREHSKITAAIQRLVIERTQIERAIKALNRQSAISALGRSMLDARRAIP